MIGRTADLFTKSMFSLKEAVLVESWVEGKKYTSSLDCFGRDS